MRTFYFSSSVGYSTLLLGDGVAQFMDSEQDAGVTFFGLFLSGYSIPLEGAVIGFFVLLGAYAILEHNVWLHSLEKFKFVIGMIHRTHMPQVLLRNGLEDIMKSGVPEETCQMLKPLLDYAEYIIRHNRNTLCLDRADWKVISENRTAEVEIHGYVQMVADLCRPYAGSHGIKLEISHSADRTSCKINESIMTGALQHLLNRIVETTSPGGCIYITASHETGFWKLQVGNCREMRRKNFTAMFSMLGYSGLKTVEKIIRLHGGRMTVYKYRNSVVYHIIVPANCHCRDKAEPGTNIFFRKKVYYLNREVQECNENTPYILLVMTDRIFGEYLQTALASEFKILLQKNFDMSKLISVKEKPDAIIIDENVNGICGDEFCSRIKSEEATAAIPVILLVEYNDNRSYLSHTGSGADRVELRTVGICRLKADIHMLINSCLLLRKQANRMLADSVHILSETIEKDDDNLFFIDKVRELLEENLATEGYTIDILTASMGMSRTAFYYKMKEVTGQPPVEYMLTYKMKRAKVLLASGKYNVTEIAGMLGYCDAKYFGKKFKSFYHVCPTGYLKKMTR